MADTGAPITDPQTQNVYSVADPNANNVESADLLGNQADDNQRILARQTPSGVSRGVQQLGASSLTMDSDNKRILVNDGVDRVLMGDQPTFGEGFYVTKPGIDVTTSTSTDDFIFNSNQNVFKIAKEGFLESPAMSLSDPGVGTYNNTAASTFALHNLNFIPAILVYLAQSGQPYIPLPYTSVVASGTAGRWFTLSVSVDSTSVYFTTEVTVLHQNFTITAGEFTAKYYLLQETAN